MRHTTDLTAGPIGRELLGLMAPLLLGNLLQQLYNAADAWIIGHVAGQTAFAAVGVAGTVMNLFLFVLSGCCAGISVLFAQLYGGGDLAAFRRETYLAGVWGVLAAVGLSLAALVGTGPLLALIQTPPEVAAQSGTYLSIVFCGLAAAYLYNLCAALLRAVGNTAAALAILAAALGLNVGLDVLFVAELGWGIAGAAWATVLAQALSAALCLGYLRLALPELLFRREDMVLDRALLRRTASLGALSALHQSSLYIGKLLVQGAVNSMGTDMIAAYTATTRLEGFANSFGDSGAAALSVFVAQNVGVGDRARVRRGFRRGLAMLTGLGLALSALLYLLAEPGVTLMSGIQAGPVVENGGAYLRTIALFYTLCYLGNAFVGWFRGLGMVGVPVAGTAGHIAVRVALSYLLIGRLGLSAVALATGIGWMGVVTFQALTFRLSRRQQAILGRLA